MEFGHGRDRLYIGGHEDAWKLHVSPLFQSSSSSSSSAAAAFRWNNSGGGSDLVEKEHMFDKVVTPSDVGKLNRLVIPKQYAEKYFPLDAAANAGGKGLLLSFEDRTGKSWRFRYSYWSSSQSYVMTKGWSRFVKDKRLDAGDTVSFGRGVGEGARERLFIDWKRRRPPEIGAPAHRLRLNPAARTTLFPQPPFPHPGLYSFARAGPAAAKWEGRQYHHHYSPRPNYHGHSCEGYGYNAASTSAAIEAQQQLVFFRSPATDAHPPPSIEVQHGGGGDGSRTMPPDSQTPAVAKSLRLFGVNLPCPKKEGDAGGGGGGGTTPTTFLPSSRETRALPLQLQHCSSAESMLASSSSTSKEEEQEQQHSSLDLDL